MTLNKPFYQSLTIIGAVVSGLAQLLNLFGLNIADLVPAITDAIGKEINATVAISGVVFAIYGRATAKHQLTLGSPPAAGNSPSPGPGTGTGGDVPKGFGPTSKT